MRKDPVSRVKEEQKKSFFLKELSGFIRDISEDEPDLLLAYPTKVEFSPGGGTCYVYFAGHSGKEDFEKALEILKLYKPSLRKAVARIYHGRYTPDIIFRYDESSEKSRRINELLDEVQDELDEAWGEAHEGKGSE